jgi:hypothetical protein
VHERLAALERLEPRDVGVAWRSRIEDDPAGDGRAGAENDVVAARCYDRSGEAQLREPVAGARDAGEGLRGAVMKHDARRNVSQRLECDIEPEARLHGSRRDEDVAATELLPLDAGERNRHALPRLGALDGPVVHLHAPHPDAAAARLDAELVPVADRA